MAGSSGTGPREVGPSGPKEKKPRRGRVHALVSVGAVMLAIAAIAATAWALSRGEGGPDAGPDASEATSESGTPSTDLEWNTATPSPTAPLFSMPTLSTPSTADDETPTSPFSFPAPSATTTPPRVTSPTITYPYNTPTTTTPTIASPTTTPPTTTPTTQPPAPITVRAVAPRAKKITRCGTFGSLRVVKTTGVRYVRTVGDGRQGRWVVKASARKGYRLEAGSPRRFTGNLGKFRPCPGDPYIDGEVTPTPTGDPETWDVTVRTVVPGKEPLELEVTYTFTTEVEISERIGADWDCGDAKEVEGDVVVSCTFDYTGQAPPAVTLRVLALDPHGGVTLSSGGTTWATDFF